MIICFGRSVCLHRFIFSAKVLTQKKLMIFLFVPCYVYYCATRTTVTNKKKVISFYVTSVVQCHNQSGNNQFGKVTISSSDAMYGISLYHQVLREQWEGNINVPFQCCVCSYQYISRARVVEQKKKLIFFIALRSCLLSYRQCRDKQIESKLYTYSAVLDVRYFTNLN